MRLDNTPWGKPQQQEQLAEGIIEVSTAGHGGLWVSAARVAQMPVEFKGLNRYGGPGPGGSQWYEENRG